MTWRGSEDFARELGPGFRWVRGMIRRMSITLTTGTLWQMLGRRGGTGGDETPSVETFPGIGFYARPSTSGKPEAIAVAPGGNKGLVAIATRDEKTRQALFAEAGELADDETAVYNSQCLVVLRADGSVEIRLAGGAAVPLATKADVDAIKDYLRAQFDPATGHTHKAVVPAQTTQIAESAGGFGGTCPAPAGTSVLKGQ